MSRFCIYTALLIAAALTFDSFVTSPVFGIQWHSPEWMAHATAIFNVIKLLLMAVLTGYLWWVVPKCEFRPAGTMALQFITLLCAVHAIVLLVARQNLLSDKQSIQSVGPITVVAIDEQESRTSKQIVYLRCQRALGFYSLHELLYLPNQEVATVGKKESTWYLHADKEYKLIDDSTMTTLCK